VYAHLVINIALHVISKRRRKSDIRIPKRRVPKKEQSHFPKDRHGAAEVKVQ